MKIPLFPVLVGVALCPALGLGQTPPVQPGGLGGTQSKDAVPPAPNGQTPPIIPKLLPIPVPPAYTIPGPPGAPPGSAANRPLTAAEAASLALRVQPSLRLARAAILAAEGDLQIARSGLLPTVSLVTDYTRDIMAGGGIFSFPAQTRNSSSVVNSSSSTSTTDEPLGVFSGLSTSLTLRQLIFDFNHTRDLVSEAEAERRAAKQGLSLAQLNLVYAVKQSFYTYSQDEELVTVQASNVDNAQAEYALANARLLVGLGEPSDVVTAITTLGNASSALTQAQDTALIARINLALAIGVDPRTPIVLSTSDEPAPAASDLNTLVTQALKTRNDLLQAQETASASRHGLSAARTANSPSLAADVSGDLEGAGAPLNQSSGSIGLSLTWNFDDGGLTAGQIKQARASLENSLAQVEITKQTVISDVAQALVNLRTSEQRVVIATPAVSDAQEGLQLSEGRYKAGVALFVEVTTAQTNLVQAQTNLVSAQIGVELARAELRHAIGLL